MKTVEDITLLEEGVFPSHSGEEVTITAQDMQELAESYDPENLHEAFIVPGHTSDPMFGQPDTDTAVSLGWIKSVYYDKEDRKLKAKVLELHDKLVEWLTQGLYRYKSLAFYSQNDPRNPTPGKLHIRHLAVLGSQPPAIKGLGALLAFSEETIRTIALKQPITDEEKEQMYKKLNKKTPQLMEKPDRAKALAEKGKAPMGNATMKSPEGLAEDQLLEEENTIEGLQEGDDESNFDDIPSPEDVPEEELGAFFQENTPLLLAEILSSGDRGYKGEITRFDPEPSEENNFLFDAEMNKFEGAFVDESEDVEEVYDFTVRREGDEWTFEYKLVSGEDEEPLEEGEEDEDPIEDSTPAEDVVEDLDPDNVALGEGCPGCEENRTLAAPATSLPEAQVFNEDMGVSHISKMDMMASEIAMLRAQVAELKEMAMQRFMEMAFGENRILASNLAESDLRAFAESLYDLSKQATPSMVAFSEGSGKAPQASLFEVFSTLVERLPKQVEVGVALSEGSNAPLKRISAPEPPPGYRNDPDAEAVFGEIKAFAEANSLDINRHDHFQLAIKGVYKNK